MKDRLDCARLIFAAFQSGYDQAPGRIWSLGFGADAQQKLGLSQDELRAGIAVLMSKRLIQMMGTRGYRLDDAGTQACIHPELLDQHLGPKHAASPVQHVTIHAHEMNNTQIGHHNTMVAAHETLAFSVAVPEEKRAPIMKALTKLRESLECVDEPGDRAEATATLSKVEQQLTAPSPRLDRMKSYLELYATIVTVAAPTVDILKQLLATIFP